MLSNGQALPSFIVLDSANRIFQIKTTNSSDAGSYIIHIYGQPVIGPPTVLVWDVTIKNVVEPKFKNPISNIRMHYDE